MYLIRFLSIGGLLIYQFLYCKVSPTQKKVIIISVITVKDKMINQVVFSYRIQPVSALSLNFCVSLAAGLVLRNRNRYLMAC